METEQGLQKQDIWLAQLHAIFSWDVTTVVTNHEVFNHQINSWCRSSSTPRSCGLVAFNCRCLGPICWLTREVGTRFRRFYKRRGRWYCQCFWGAYCWSLNSTPISQPLERHRVEKGETKTIFITAGSSGGGCGLDVNLRFSMGTYQLWVPRGLLAWVLGLIVVWTVTSRYSQRR